MKQILFGCALAFVSNGVQLQNMPKLQLLQQGQLPTLNVEYPAVQSLDEGDFPTVQKPTPEQAAAAGCEQFGQFQDVLSYLNGNDVTGAQMIQSHFQEPDMVKMQAQAEEEAKNSPLAPPDI